MATLDDVRRIASELPDAFEKIEGHRGGASWRTKAGMFAWERGPSKTDLAQLEALGREWPVGTVLGIRTDGLEAREELLAAFPECFFTIPHLDGHPAVLLRLAEIDVDLLREVLVEAWLLRTARTTADRWLVEHGLEP